MLDIPRATRAPRGPRPNRIKGWAGEMPAFSGDLAYRARCDVTSASSGARPIPMRNLLALAKSFPGTQGKFRKPSRTFGTPLMLRVVENTASLCCKTRPPAVRNSSFASHLAVRTVTRSTCKLARSSSSLLSNLTVLALTA